MFTTAPRDRGSTPGRVIPRTQKWNLMPPYLALSMIRLGSRVKWSNPGNGGVAIEKGAFRLPSTKVANFTYLVVYIRFVCTNNTYIYVCVCVCVCVWVFVNVYVCVYVCVCVCKCVGRWVFPSLIVTCTSIFNTLFYSTI